MGESNSSIATDNDGKTFIKEGLNHTFKKVILLLMFLSLFYQKIAKLQVFGTSSHVIYPRLSCYFPPVKFES